MKTSLSSSHTGLGTRTAEFGRKKSPYRSVEFSIKGLDTPYQFKIWNMASSSMCVVVREDSDILPRLREGDTLYMKFYLTDSGYPCRWFQTAIRSITRDDEGPFKGHYMVGLEIVRGQE